MGRRQGHVSVRLPPASSHWVLAGLSVNHPTTLCWDEGAGRPGTLMAAPHGWVLPGPEELLAQPRGQKELA